MYGFLTSCVLRCWFQEWAGTTWLEDGMNDEFRPLNRFVTSTIVYNFLEALSVIPADFSFDKLSIQ